MRIGTLNLASGRGDDGVSVSRADLVAAVADLDVDVLALQEVDVDQPRSHHVHQAAVLGFPEWRFAATLAGTPDPFASWTALPPALDHGDLTGPHYGVALLLRLPVRRWHVLGLTAGPLKLPLVAPDPRTGSRRLWWFPDEPRAAIAAELDGLTVVGTHLSFAAPTAARQLRRVHRWARSLPGPVVVAGDLNLGGSLSALVTGGRRLVAERTWPAPDPKVQFDHVLSLGGVVGSDPLVTRLSLGDHRLVTVQVAASGRPA
ncbi:Metal-dependent hydrolase, endonuclease/exonuclease/phosphatase family [Klenkia soli]|uniref:Metal-dependent hydrolase, endonuclease/exonuclease/phosphatase family n=1 Tax=Klenkia soli TaxID=1052260 RepID=A0A1H0P2G5_9ACTN|nr:endonuclease/exonuclease/phosphatase family protein [Klenkia soli]SDO98885.1 Metal-dependent hydrolase, endonuclease/exonuclease/phosphatase family [Klenkia soli]